MNTCHNSDMEDDELKRDSILTLQLDFKACEKTQVSKLIRLKENENLEALISRLDLKYKMLMDHMQ